MHSRELRLLLTLLVAAGFLIAITATYRSTNVEVAPRQEGIVLGQWEHLTDLPWQSAETAWVAVANEGLPSIDKSFTGEPISIAGVVYERGIGTYPLSEVVYKLDGEYVSFESDAGVDDSVPPGRGGVIFQVYLDDAMAYSSGTMKSGDPPMQIQVPLVGINTMRLVTIDATGGNVRNYANWANARVLKRLASLYSVGSSPILSIVRERNDLKSSEREKDRGNLATLADAEIADFKKAFGAQDVEGTVSAVLDVERSILQLSNSRIGIELGYGGFRHGYLSILDLEEGQLVLHDDYASANFNGAETIALPIDTLVVEGGYQFTDIADPVFGQGKRLEADFRVKNEPTIIAVEITLFDESRYLLYGLRLKDVVYIAEPPPTFNFFEGPGDTLAVDEEVEYLTDFSRLRRGRVYDDGIVRKERISQGKPFFIWSNRTWRGFLMAALDETEMAPAIGVQLKPGRVVAQLDYSSPAMRDSLSSPRLYIELTETADTREAFTNFKHFFAVLYPPLPLPSWVKYQWLSWYPYGMDITEEALQGQIDYIAENLADLGPWHIIVDAGWYVAEGREGADWRAVDYGKFPGGLRSLVDYAHARDVKVVLYISTPYLDSREQPGDWLGLKGLIQDHRDWLLPIGESDGRESFVYDYTNPELRSYMERVLWDFYMRYDVDGMKVDGLGNAGGALLDPNRLDAFGLIDRVVGPTMDIYRFNYQTATSLKNDIYIESGWLNPLFANLYAHTFRFGDERDDFSYPYPFPGLVEHIEYAQAQKMILGQRSNMGAARGDPNFSYINRWMLEAGLALGTQVVLSFYLPAMTDETINSYRSLLYHYNAFEGETYYGSPYPADTFATTVGDTTYLGVLNREAQVRQFTLPLGDFGLVDGEDYTVYKVEENSYLRVRDSFEVALPPESFALYILRSEPGVMWTNSAIEHDEAGSEMVLTVAGPPSLPGFVQVLVPQHGAVFLDGQELIWQEAGAEVEAAYQYDAETRIIAIRYDHESEHEIRITGLE